MEDFVALRKRANAMYESNTSPRHSPYFPPPPSQFLSPEEFLVQLAEAVFVNSPKVQHPFVVKLVKGEWSLKHIQEWACSAVRTISVIAVGFEFVISASESPKAFPNCSHSSG